MLSLPHMYPYRTKQGIKQEQEKQKGLQVSQKSLRRGPKELPKAARKVTALSGSSVEA